MITGQDGNHQADRRKMMRQMLHGRTQSLAASLWQMQPAEQYVKVVFVHSMAASHASVSGIVCAWRIRIRCMFAALTDLQALSF